MADRNGQVGEVDVAADEVVIGVAIVELDEEIDLARVGAKDVFADLDDDPARAVCGAVGSADLIWMGIVRRGIENVEALDGCAVGDGAVELKGKIVELGDGSLEGEIFECSLRGGESASERNEGNGLA